eukprot:82306-Amphidinium_carterae.1
MAQRQERLLRQLFENLHAQPAAPSTPPNTVASPATLTAQKTAQLISQTSNLSTVSVGGDIGPSVRASGSAPFGSVGTKTLSFIQEDENRRNKAQHHATDSHHPPSMRRGKSSTHEKLACCFMACTCTEVCTKWLSVRRLVTSHAFEVFFAVLIMSNSLLIGMEVEWMARTRSQDVPNFFRLLNWTYGMLFLMELVMR